MLNIILLLTVIFYSLSSFCNKERDNGSVEHKNKSISEYLNEISEEQEEKTQIIDHILNNLKGTYLDIGTGGDSISHILNNLPEDKPITIIGSDIDNQILKEIPLRHPNINSYINESNPNKLRLNLIRMDATNMYPILEDSIDGVSASALTHEIFSYVPTKSSLDQFFLEIIRVLKKDGVFIYRDPKWDDNPNQDCLLILKDILSKYFSALFLPRFLDRQFSKRLDYKNQCIKPTIYEKSYIRINFYLKGSNTTKKTKLDDFINTPLSHIDFSKNISIEAPRGLISEIQRHYILFLKNNFITELIDKNFFNKSIINIDDLPIQEKKILKNFISSKNISNSIIDTSLEVFNKILSEKRDLYNLIENGICLKLLNKEKAEKICSDLYNKGIKRDLISIQSDKLWADAKIALILFQDIKSGIYECIDTENSNIPFQVFEWMKREGEEFYFYKTTDELITYIGMLTKHYLSDTNKEGFILCPENHLAVKTVSRDLYKDIIDTHMHVIDIDGNKQDIIFDKNIIHFKLMPKDQALKVYRDLIKNNNKYKELQEWVINDLR